jgi:hypothetical protein
MRTKLLVVLGVILLFGCGTDPRPGAMRGTFGHSQRIKPRKPHRPRHNPSVNGNPIPAPPQPQPPQP